MFYDILSFFNVFVKVHKYENDTKKKICINGHVVNGPAPKLYLSAMFSSLGSVAAEI